MKLLRRCHPFRPAWRHAAALLLGAVLLACGPRVDESFRSWPRPSWEPGGEKDFLFFVVYGEIDPKSVRPSRRYRTAGVPAGFKVGQFARTADPCAVFQDGYFWSGFQKRRPEMAAAVAKAAKCTRFRRGGRRLEEPRLPAGHRRPDHRNPRSWRDRRL
jgi:hypothetical protein